MAFTPKPKQSIDYRPPVERSTNPLGSVPYISSTSIGTGGTPVYFTNYNRTGYFRQLSGGNNIFIYTGSTVNNSIVGTGDTIVIGLQDNISVSNLSASTYFSGSTPLQTAITNIVNNIAASGASPFQIYGTSTDWNITNINPSSYTIIGIPRYSIIAQGVQNGINQTAAYNSNFITLLNGRNNYVTNGNYHTIVGGRYGVISGNDTQFSTILNGSLNQIKSNYGLIGNGNGNYIKAGSNRATIINGYQNIISQYSHHASILAGFNNQVKSPYSTIVNGINNVIESGLTNVVLLNVDNHTATESNTVYINKLNIFSAITGGNLMLTYDSVNGNVHTQSIPTGSTSTINNGTNTFTGGTSLFQSVNVTGLSLNNLTVSGLSSFNSISATTFYSGSTNLNDLFVISGTTLGAGEVIFTGKSGNNLQFKSIAAGSNITLNSNASQLTINAVIPAGANLWTNGNGTYSIMANNSTNYAGGNYSLVAGKGNLLYSSNNYSTILNGSVNTIKSNSYWSNITNGNYNYIGYATRGSILNGYQNRIYTNNATNSNDSLIGNGLNNKIINSQNSFIGNGMNNTILNAPFASILNGTDNLVIATGATIINGSFITATTNNCVYVDNLNIENATNGGNLMLTLDSVNGNVHTQPIPTGSTSTSSTINNGINTFTGGTPTFQSVNVTGLSINNLTVSGVSSFSSISASTYYSGSTNLNDLFGNKIQFVSKTSNQSHSGSSTIVMTDLSFNVESGKKYFIDFVLLLSGGTGGMRTGVSGNTAPENNLIMQGNTGAITALQTTAHRTNGLNNGQTIATATSFIATESLKGYVNCTGATGTVSLVYQAISAGNWMTVLAGSSGKIELMN